MTKKYKIETAQQGEAAIKQVDSVLKKVMKRLDDGTALGLNEFGNEILKETLPITPKKTGALRDTAKIDVKRFKNKSKMSVSFGGPAPNFPGVDVHYAYHVHETFVDPSHRTTPGTTHKYLIVGYDKSKEKGLKKMIEKMLSFLMGGSFN